MSSTSLMERTNLFQLHVSSTSLMERTNQLQQLRQELEKYKSTQTTQDTNIRLEKVCSLFRLHCPCGPIFAWQCVQCCKVGLCYFAALADDKSLVNAAMCVCKCVRYEYE